METKKVAKRAKHTFGPGTLLRGLGLCGLGRPDSLGQALRKGPGPSEHLGWPLRTHSQLSPEDLSPAHGLGSVTPGLVPLADDLAKLQPPLLHLLGLGSHLLLGRRNLFSSRLRLCPR